MKTAMQELIDSLDYAIEQREQDEGVRLLFGKAMLIVRNLATDLLETEKKHIINAHFEGACNQTGCAYNSERYFTQTYNP